MESSAIRELLKLTEQPDIISFGGGLPAPDVFPVEEFNAACDRVLRNHGAMALQYSTTEGFLPLREMIARHSARYGIKITPDNVLITSGSQQALDLLGKILIDPGDRILVESPTYLAAIQAWNAYGAEFITVPMDSDGMNTDYLEEALRAGPKFIYVLPNFQNPTGETRKLIALADQYGVPIVEDDPYGQLRYEGDHLPSIVVLDSQFRDDTTPCYRGNVIYLSTFSKTLAPGLRLGWVVAPPEVISKLVQAKQGADLHTATFNQLVAFEVARGGFLDRHIHTIRDVYGRRRNLMMTAMEREFPSEVSWTHPQGGLFIWGTLPTYMDAKDLLKTCLERKVAFVPGEPFHPTGGGKNTMRINFSNATHDEIELGIRRLGISIGEKLARQIA
jgi:2-aminoadipate transaminase